VPGNNTDDEWCTDGAGDAEESGPPAERVAEASAEDQRADPAGAHCLNGSLFRGSVICGRDAGGGSSQVPVGGSRVWA
jgi:hypothetical protein